VNSNEIILFGGFNDGPLDTVYHYKNTDPKQEGEFLNANTPDKLDCADFFINNGQYLEVPKKYVENQSHNERVTINCIY
jgi:hypothetical protein